MPSYTSKESPIDQYSGEIIQYNIDFTAYPQPAATLSSPAAKLTRMDTGADVTATNLSGNAAVSGQTVLVTVTALTPLCTYRLDVTCVKSGNTLAVETIFRCPS